MSVRPNILLILTDQQSADALGCARCDNELRTPVLDELARSGMRFNRAYCSHPLCVPSRASLFSGHYPHRTGVLSNGDLERDLSAFPCLGKRLAEAGYETAYFGKWHMPYPLDEASRHGFATCRNIRDNGADLHNADEATEFLSTPRDKPFFLVVSYNNPHNICEWARGARGDLPDGSIPPPPPLRDLPPSKPNYAPETDEPEALRLMRKSYHANPLFPVGGFTEEDWRIYRWAYHRMVETVDARVGRILETLEANDQRNHTAIVFLSDHGDAQGAHGWNQKTILSDESARVPCLISFPSRISAGESNQLIQTGIDLTPTICDLAGVEPRDPLPGASMLVSAGRGEDRRRPYVVTETRFLQGCPNPEPGTPELVNGRMLRSDRYKYCVYDWGEHRESLFEMDTDPGETVNLARRPDRQSILDQHRAWFAEWSESTGDTFQGVAPSQTDR